MPMPDVAALYEYKNFLGQISHLNFTDCDSVHAHMKLGMEVKTQTQQILRRKLDEWSREQIIAQLTAARDCQRAMLARLDSPQSEDPVSADALRQYLVCLSAWARGAELDEFHHEKLHGLGGAGGDASAEDLALVLQHERTGCQTGVLRDDDGSILLWHTEEERESAPGERFDKLRLASFRAGGNHHSQTITAFIYPDLLPGPAFGWRSDHYVQAIDSLYVKEHSDRNAVFANIAAWVRLWLGGTQTGEEVMRWLGPFRDGYAVTSAHRRETDLIAEKIEFANDQFLSAPLADTPGAFLFQVNLFSDSRSALASHGEDIGSVKERALRRRIARTHRALRVIEKSGDRLQCLFRLLASRVGGEFAYSNLDVKASFVCRLSREKSEIWVGAGPAMENEARFAVTL